MLLYCIFWRILYHIICQNYTSKSLILVFLKNLIKIILLNLFHNIYVHCIFISTRNSEYRLSNAFNLFSDDTCWQYLSYFTNYSTTTKAWNDNLSIRKDQFTFTENGPIYSYCNAINPQIKWIRKKKHQNHHRTQ